MIKFKCFSDIHWLYGQFLEQYQLLNLSEPDTETELVILAGDIDLDIEHTPPKIISALRRYFPVAKIIFVPGNHNGEHYNPKTQNLLEDFGLDAWLDNSEYIYKGIKIYGFPYWECEAPNYINVCARNYMCWDLDKSSDMYKAIAKIPNDVDILVTHTPPYGILDTCRGTHFGSPTLRSWIDNPNTNLPKYHIFGHIHESGGKTLQPFDHTQYTAINAAVLNEQYTINRTAKILLKMGFNFNNKGINDYERDTTTDNNSQT